MRVLTVISGIILAAAGAFTFAFYTNAFTGLAFILGIVMLLSGLCSLGAYVLSTKVSRLPDTVLVEGMVTALFGFAVLNNEISDAMVSLFFGTWLTLAGATRISQSFAVSRYRPKDWSKIMPLAIVAAVQGLMMLMPTLTSSINSMFFVGSAFIVNGFSQLIYAMYMRRHELTEREIEARERAEARRIAKEKEREERNLRRNASHQEKEESQKFARLKQKADADAERAERMNQIQERKKAQKAALDATVQFTPEETAQVLAAAGAQMADNAAESDAKAAEKAIPVKEESTGKADPNIEAQAERNSDPNKEAQAESKAESVDSKAAPAHENPSGKAETKAAAPADSPENNETKAESTPASKAEDKAESAVNSPASTPEAQEAAKASSAEETVEKAEAAEAESEPDENPELELIKELAKAPAWNRPTEIPSLRARKLEAEAAQEEKEERSEEIAPIKLAAVNISEIEEGLQTVEFDPVELPEPELQATGGESEHRSAIIEDLEKEVKNNSAFKPFKALDLDDLFGEDYVPLREKDPKEATRFTQSLNIDWEKFQK